MKKQQPDLDGYFLEPINDRIIIRRDEQKTEVTPGGIIKPNFSYNIRGEAEDIMPPVTGTVVAAGPGVLDDAGIFRATVVKAGDRILLSKHGGAEVSLPDGTEIVIARESDILGVFRKKK